MKPKSKKVIFIIEDTRTGYSAYAKDYPIGTTGSTKEELRANIKEALSLYFDRNVPFEIRKTPK